MYLEPKVRAQFAEAILDAAGINDSNKRGIFANKFSRLPSLQKDGYSNFWMDKVKKWIEFEHKSQMASLINQNYNNPQTVLDYIIEHKKPI